jgi:hypothetical protein
MKTQPLIRIRRRQTAALLAGSMLTLLASGHGVPAAGAEPRPPQEFPMKIRMDVDGRAVLATLDDTAASRDFAALLPLSLTLTDYAEIERIADLPQKLSIEGTPAGVAPRAGDITYYAPWGNLAIFVKGRSYARGLVRMGRVESGLPALQRSAPLQVRIERIDE